MTKFSATLLGLNLYMYTVHHMMYVCMYVHAYKQLSNKAKRYEKQNDVNISL